MFSKLFKKSVAKNDLVHAIFKDKPNAGTPHIHEQIPYRVFDDKMRIFENTNSIGFAKEIGVLDGMDQSLIEELHSMICNLPTGRRWHYQFVMTGNHKIANSLEMNKRAHSTSDFATKRAKEQRDFYEMASSKGFLTSKGNKASWFDIKDYRCFLFVTYKARNTKENKRQLKEVEEDISTALDNKSIYHNTLNHLQFISYVKNILNQDTEDTHYPEINYNENEYINKQCLSPSTYINKHAQNYIDTEFDGKEQRIASLGLTNLPNSATLNEYAEFLSSSTNIGLSLRCPFISSVGFQIEDPVKTDNSIKSKLENVKKHANDRIQASAEINDFQYVQDKKADDKDFKLVWTYNTLTLLSNKEDHDKDVKAAESLFTGYKVLKKRQLEALKMILPFTSVDVLQSLQKTGLVHRLTSFNVTNMLPLAADWKGCQSGIPLLGQRNQICFIDHFSLGTMNYNSCVVGDSGSGKSVLTQLILDSLLAMGAEVYIIDNGFSHEKFVKRNDGSHTSMKGIKLNPFININIEKLKKARPDDWQYLRQISLENAALLISIMIDPTGESMSNFKYKLITEVVNEVFQEKEHLTTIDDLFHKFVEKAKNNPADTRYTDIPVEIKQFTSGGIYGDYFVGENNLDENIPLHCVEIDGFSDSLKPLVIFSMFLFMGTKVFMGDRDIYKAIVIEEFKLFEQIKHKYVTSSLEKYIRAVRKYNGAIFTITQQISDYFANEFMVQFFKVANIKYILYQPGEVLDALSSTNKEDRHGFTDYEISLLRKFRPSKEQGFSSVLLKLPEYSSCHRLFLSPQDKIITTTHPIELAFLERMKRDGVNLNEAINKAMWEFYEEDMERFEEYKRLKYQNDK